MSPPYLALFTNCLIFHGRSACVFRAGQLLECHHPSLSEVTKPIHVTVMSPNKKGPRLNCRNPLILMVRPEGFEPPTV